MTGQWATRVLDFETIEDWVSDGVRNINCRLIGVLTEGSILRYVIAKHSMTNTSVRNTSSLLAGTGRLSATRYIHHATMLHEYQSMNDVTFGFLIHLSANVNVMPGNGITPEC